jgi:hypothetical protein
VPVIDKYKSRLILRPQEISNHPEVIRRLGLICINTALECDIYGNINSTHVNGTHMMNGIGGSGDFARNASYAVFVTKSLAKNGNISSVVPMVTHVDHNEHDVDLIVTEVGLADLRGLAPRVTHGQRGKLIWKGMERKALSALCLPDITKTKGNQVYRGFPDAEHHCRVRLPQVARATDYLSQTAKYILGA